MTVAPIELCLLRHAASAAPVGCALGQWDVPLSVRGAEALERLLDDWPHPLPSMIVSSDLVRARQTAERIAARLAVPFRIDPDWREVSLGRWQGRSWREIERDEGDALADWYANWREHAAPGGEAWPAVLARVGRATARLAAIDSSAGPMLVVSHAGAIRAFLIAVAGLGEDAAFGLSLPPLGSVTARLAAGGGHAEIASCSRR